MAGLSDRLALRLRRIKPSTARRSSQLCWYFKWMIARSDSSS